MKKENKGIENSIIRDNTKLFEHEEGENCYKPVRVITISNLKVTMIEKKDYQLKNILIKLDHA